MHLVCVWNCGLCYHPLLPYSPLPPPPLSLLFPPLPPSLPRFGQVNFILALRLELLQEVEKLQKSLSVTGDVSYTCETVAYFFLYQVTTPTNTHVDAHSTLEECIKPFNIVL